MMSLIKNRLQISKNIIPDNYWEATVSGNVVELRVLPSLDRKPGEYRLGVIQIGRIIAKVETLAKNTGTSPQIQLFPNLAENQLAATVYWPRLFSSGDLIDPETPSQTEKVSPAGIKKIVDRFSFSLELADNQDDDSESPAFKTYHVLTKSSQPFIWLKIGQMIQQLLDRYRSDYNNGSFDIQVTSSAHNMLHGQANKKKYCQLKLHLQTE